jgi:hypothetical protein
MILNWWAQKFASSVLFVVMKNIALASKNSVAGFLTTFYQQYEKKIVTKWKSVSFLYNYDILTEPAFFYEFLTNRNVVQGSQDTSDIKVAVTKGYLVASWFSPVFEVP